MADSKPLQAASALFQQFETVFHAKADLFSGPAGYKNLSKQDANALRLPFAYLIGSLDSLPDNAASRLFANADAVLVGAKSFRPPAGLGSVRSQFCYVVILKNPNTFELWKYFPQPSSDSTRELTVWNWGAELGEFGENDPRPSSLYATQVANSYTLVSNSLDEMQAMARLLASSADSRGPSGISEWASVSQHDVWGYRRYRHTGIADRIAGGMKEVTPGAEALIFFPDSERSSGVLRLLNAPADERTAANLNAAGKLPPFRSSGSGVWQTSIPLSSDEKTMERMLIIMSLFGFGLYL